LKEIIFVGQLPPIITGQSLVTLEVLDILKKNSFKVHLIRLNNKSTFKIFPKLGIFINYLSLILKFATIAIRKRKIAYLPGARSKSGLVRTAILVVISKLFNNKIIIHFHCGDYDQFLSSEHYLWRKLAILVFSKVDNFILLGSGLKEGFRVLGDAEDKTFIIPNGISLASNILKNTSEEKLKKLLFLSNMIESKGYLDIIEALRLLKEKYFIEDFHCDFCGEFLMSDDTFNFDDIEVAERHFFQKIQEYKLGSNVSYRGLVKGFEKQAILAKSGIFILPTYYHSEAQPLSILEAMSAGLIVISTNYRAISDMVINDQTGIIVSPKSPEELAYAIYSIWNNINKAQDLINNANQHLILNFSMRGFERNILNLFNSLQAQ
jgi:glycosyltransferase involved in cell wall biosynthesis